MGSDWLLQQLKVISANIRCRQFTTMITQDTRGLVGRQKNTKSKITVTHRTMWHSIHFELCLWAPTRQTQQSACTTCVFIYRLIKWQHCQCFRDENTHVDCLSTSLFDHFLMNSTRIEMTPWMLGKGKRIRRICKQSGTISCHQYICNICHTV